jgi:formylglycine-generating enzyme required for sulfatase activity
LEVTGGTYYRTYTSDADGGALGLDDPAMVSSFRLDKYDVTVGRFGQFVNAVFPADGGAGWLPVVGSGKHTHLNGGLGLTTEADADAGQTYEPGWSATDDSFIEPNASPTCSPTWTAAGASQDNLPMNCVNWDEAYAFCIWDGGFLPSEAEWEYAAAGGSQQREYPWGSTDPGTANRYAIYACNYPVGPPLCQDGGNIALVGTAMLGAARWGQLDMAGEVYEWTLDVQSTYVDPCANCANLTASAPSPARVIRGGSANSSKSFLLASSRANDDSVDRQSVIGFRCARSP